MDLRQQRSQPIAAEQAVLLDVTEQELPAERSCRQHFSPHRLQLGNELLQPGDPVPESVDQPRAIDTVQQQQHATLRAIAPASRRAPWIAGLALLALFLPVQIGIASRSKLWHPLFLLGTLMPLVAIGATMLLPRSPANSPRYQPPLPTKRARAAKVQSGYRNHIGNETIRGRAAA